MSPNLLQILETEFTNDVSLRVQAFQCDLSTPPSTPEMKPAGLERQFGSEWRHRSCTKSAWLCHDSNVNYALLPLFA